MQKRHEINDSEIFAAMGSEESFFDLLLKKPVKAFAEKVRFCLLNVQEDICGSRIFEIYH